MNRLPPQLAAAAALTPELYAALSPPTQTQVFTALCTALHQRPLLTLVEGKSGANADARRRTNVSIAEGGASTLARAS